MDLFIIFGVVLICAFVLEQLLRQLKISNYETRYVLVTGCDSGFGHEAARKLHRLNFKVFACCLTKSAVEEINAEGLPGLKAIEMDVTKDASIEKAVEIIKRMLPENKGLWAVVNNAGIIGGIGSIKLQSRQDYENTLAVNLYGVIMVTKAFMPLIQKEKGRVINTSSILGRLAMLNVSYCVSKYAVEAFSDVLRRENYKTGVKVMIVEPGAYKTPIFYRDYIKRMAEAKLASLPAEIRSELPNDAVEQLEAAIHLIGDTGSTNIGKVADAYIHAITARYPRKRYVVGTDARFVFRTLWMIPEWLSDWFIDRYIGCSI